jgi:hypothetical protein
MAGEEWEDGKIRLPVLAVQQDGLWSILEAMLLDLQSSCAPSVL